MQLNFSDWTANGTGIGTSFVSNYINLLLITNTRGNKSNETAFYSYDITNYFTGSGSSPPYTWICMDTAHPGEAGMDPLNCDITQARKDSTTWTLNGNKIEYCLAQETDAHCKLQFSVQILIVVIIMNVGKTLTMFLTLYRHSELTLVTVGDAMASWLERPDDLTKGRCLMSKNDVSKGPLRWRLRQVKDKPNTQPLPVRLQRV
jgi:hypothetical protein